jgi:hypothetical protein
MPLIPLARVAAAALTAGSALLLLAAPREALAQAADAKGERVIVLWVEGGGKKDGEVRETIKKKVPSGVRVVDDAAFRKAMIKAGQKLPYGRVLAKGPFRSAALDRTRKALAELKAEGAILGLVRIGKGGQEVVLLYVEARDTGEEPDVDVPILLKGDVSTPVGEALSSQIAAWSGANPPEPPPAEPPPKEEEPKAQPKEEPEEEPKEEEPEDDGEGRPANQYGREIFSVAAAFDLTGRWFGYNDGVTENLRDYDVFGQPGFQIGAEVYPLAGTDVPVMKDLGLTGRFGMVLGLSSAVEGDETNTITTSWTRFDVGLRLRLRTGSEEAPVLGLHGGFGLDSFDLEAEGALGDEVPSASYKFLRVGVDGRIPIGPVAINLFFDYLGAVSAGTVYDRFTGSSIGGIATGGGFIVPIASGFEVRLGAEYERWFYAFEPVVGDAFVAGGALDERIHLTLGPAYVF